MTDLMGNDAGREQADEHNPVERSRHRKGWLLTYPTLACVLVAMVGFGLAILGFVVQLQGKATSAIHESQSLRVSLEATRDDLDAARDQLTELQAQNSCRGQLAADDRVATLATIVSLGQLVQGIEVARADPNAYQVASQSFDQMVAAATAQLDKSRNVDAQCPAGG